MEKEGLILIVDDDIISRRILNAMFEDIYEIAEARNGHEALAIIRHERERLLAVVLDLQMPEMDGYSLIEIMFNDDKLREIPILIATAECAVESDQRLIDMGIANIIHKPINPNIVKGKLINIINYYKKMKQIIKLYTIQNELLCQTTNTFFVNYQFQNGHVEINESSRLLSKDFLNCFKVFPFNVEKFVLPKDLRRITDFLNLKESADFSNEIEIKLYTKNKRYEWFKIYRMENYDNERRLESVSFLFKDVDEEKEAKEKLFFMAMNDRLTHIPNMRTFADDVCSILKSYPNERFYMLTMDISQFRIVNKTFGYNEGDNILKYIATKLQEIIESFEKGVYCRMTSDIFYACFSEHEDRNELVRILQDSMTHYPLKYNLKLCFGFYRIGKNEFNVESMIEHAKYAVTEAKQNLHHPVVYYNKWMEEQEFFESFVVSEMNNALKKEEFEVYMQPKCNLTNNRIIGSEALIRWNNPEKGYLSPGIFIPIFEKNGFVTELDYSIYEKVCKTIRRWIDDGNEALPVSVNVSRYSLYDHELLDNILKIVERYQIPHELIEFEITESAFISDSELLTKFTTDLQKHGFKVLLDDFGSGYSGLNSLKTLHVDVVKIDIKFLPVSEEENMAGIILASVIDMAKRLGLDIIAEGVETQEQLELLRELGCEKIQGYYYYRPMPIDEYEAVLLQQKAENGR